MMITMIKISNKYNNNSENNKLTFIDGLLPISESEMENRIKINIFMTLVYFLIMNQLWAEIFDPL